MQYTVHEEISIFGDSFIRLMDGKVIFYDNKSESYEYYVENVKYSSALELYNVLFNLYFYQEHPVLIIEESVVNGINVIKFKKK